MIRAVFFDLDDTLIDAMPCHIEANDLAFKHFGISYKEVEKKTQGYDFLGLRVKDILRIMRDSLGYSEDNLSLNELTSIRESYFLSLVKKKALILPGAKKAIINSKKAFEVLVVVSSGTRKYVKTALEKFSLLKYVDYIVSAEDVEIGKPSPDCYLKAFKLLPPELHIRKNEVLVIEDSANGVEAGSKAGLKTLLVPSKHNIKKIKADMVIPSLDKFDVKSIKRKL